MNKQLYILLLLLTITTTSNCMQEQKQIQQLAIIKSFLDQPKITIPTLVTEMDDIENKKLSYPDYDNRTGLIFSEFLVPTLETTKIQEAKRRTIRVEVDKKIHDYKAKSSFDHPIIQKILTCQILPKTFEYIKTYWTPLPHTVFGQLYLQRCHTGNAMAWHQDPGEYYDTMADYSLVLMLGKQDDPEHGWLGGEFKIKPGLPTDDSNNVHAQTVIHEQNQAVLFNNKLNSHSVTEILSNVLKSKRDLIVVTIFLGKQPIEIGNAQ